MVNNINPREINQRNWAETPSARRGLSAFWNDHWHFVVLFAFLVAFLVWSHMTNAFISMFEGGGYLSGARRVLQGEVPYRDFFLMYSPLRYYYAALILAVTPSAVDAQWLYFDTLNAANAVLAYALGRQFLRGRVWQLLPPFAAIFWCSSSDRMPLPLLSLLLLALFIRHRKPGYAFGAGIAATLGGLMLQDLLPYIAGAALVWFAALLLLQRLRGAGEPSLGPLLPALGFFVGGVVAAGAPVLIAMSATGALLPFWHDVYVIPLRHYNAQPFSFFPAPFSLPEASPQGSAWGTSIIAKFMLWALYTLPYYFLPLCYLATIGVSAWRLWKGQERQGEAVQLLIALFGLFLFRAVLGRPDEPHLIGNSLPVSFAIAGLLQRLSEMPANGKAQAVPTFARTLAVVGGVLAFGFCSYLTLKNIRHAQNNTVPVTIGLRPRTGMQEWPQAWAVAQFLRANTRPTDTVFCVSTCPFFYVLSDRNNPTKFDYFDPIIISEVEAATVQELSQSPPRYCVVQRKNPVWNREFGQDYGQSIQRWVDQNYRPLQIIGNFLVMEPKNPHLAKGG